MLEVIPLPAKPEVRLGTFKTFEIAQQLMVDKHEWACAHGGASAKLLKQFEPAGRITFARKIGAHDLAVAEVLDGERFVNYVQDYLRQRYQTPAAPIRPEFVRIIQSYLDEGFRWFAFDVIALDGTPRSREPIEYRFASDCVYYPLRISTLERGRTQVELLVFTRHGATRFLGIGSGQVRRRPRRR